MSDLKLKPIANDFTIKDHLYDVLRDYILGVDIYDTDEDLRLDERQLATQLGVSRTPIREVLARLAQDGLVEIIPRKGVFIHRKSLTEILEMVITWAALESMAARLVTQHASDDDLLLLRRFAQGAVGESNSIAISEYSDANIRNVKKLESQTNKKFTIIEGNFPNSMSNIILDKPISFAHIDVDTYISAKESFDYINANALRGAVIVLDDYGGWFTDGVTKLGNELKLNNDLFVVPNHLGQLIIYKL